MGYMDNGVAGLEDKVEELDNSVQFNDNFFKNINRI